MAVVIVNPGQVEIDGANYGAVADAIANNPQLASSIQLALNEWGTDIPGMRDRISQLEAELEAFRNPPASTENWKGLMDALRATPIFGKAFSTSSTNGWSLLLAALTYSHNLNDVAFALQSVRLGLAEDFTTEEVAQINSILSTNGIPLQLG